MFPYFQSTEGTLTGQTEVRHDMDHPNLNRLAQAQQPVRNSTILWMSRRSFPWVQPGNFLRGTLWCPVLNNRKALPHSFIIL
jgi:hypothetical protein